MSVHKETIFLYMFCLSDWIFFFLWVFWTRLKILPSDFIKLLIFIIFMSSWSRLSQIIANVMSLKAKLYTLPRNPNQNIKKNEHTYWLCALFKKYDYMVVLEIEFLMIFFFHPYIRKKPQYFQHTKLFIISFFYDVSQLERFSLKKKTHILLSLWECTRLKNVAAASSSVYFAV